MFRNYSSFGQNFEYLHAHNHLVFKDSKPRIVRSGLMNHMPLQGKLAKRAEMEPKEHCTV